MNFNKLFLSFIAILIFSCNPSHQVIVLDNPMFATDPVEDAGMDSIGFLMRKHVIVVTVKDKNEIHVYNAMNGEFKNQLKGIMLFQTELLQLMTSLYWLQKEIINRLQSLTLQWIFLERLEMMSCVVHMELHFINKKRDYTKS